MSLKICVIDNKLTEVFLMNSCLLIVGILTS